MPIVFHCPSCGRLLRVAEEYRGKRSKCPACAVVSTVPQEEEGAPGAYAVAGADRPAPAAPAPGYEAETVGPTCPGCHRVLPKGAAICVTCGFDLRTGKRRETVRTPREWYWEVGLPLLWRVGIFAALECVCLPLGAVARDPAVGATLAFAGSVFLALILGTFTTLRLVRDGRGKVLLYKRVFVCFVPCIFRTANLRRYGAVAIIDGPRGFGLIGWTVFLGLFLVGLLVGVVPGLIWWYWAFTRPSYAVALRVRHGEGLFTLYRTGSDTKMRDIVDTLQELAPLEIERR